MTIKINRLALAALAGLMLLPVSGQAENIGRLLYSDGKAQLVRNLKEQPVVSGAGLEQNDTLRVQIGARSKVMFDDDSILMMWEDTEIRLDTVEINLIAGKRIIEIEQLTGHLRLIIEEFLGEHSEIRVRTPNAIISLDGAGDFIVKQGVQGDNTEIIVFSGTPKVKHIFSEFGGDVQLEAQQTTIVGTERAPSTPVFVDRSSFDQLVAEQLWTLSQPVPDWDKFLAERLEDYGVKSFGRVRRLAAKPFTPIRTVVEGLVEQNVADRPGDLRPEPRSRLQIDIGCSSCAVGEFPRGSE